MQVGGASFRRCLLPDVSCQLSSAGKRKRQQRDLILPVILVFFHCFRLVVVCSIFLELLDYFPTPLITSTTAEKMAGRARDVEAARGSTGERSRLLGNGDSDDELIGARAAGTSQQKDKVAGVQQQVNGVMSVMQDNINKILERGENLDNLESRSENLNVNADHFRRGATQVRRRMWWNNCKMKLIIGLVVLVIVVIIVAVTVTETQKKSQ